jgi:hypothetical protein
MFFCGRPEQVTCVTSFAYVSQGCQQKVVDCSVSLFVSETVTEAACHNYYSTHTFPNFVGFEVEECYRLGYITVYAGAPLASCFMVAFYLT